LYKHERLDNGLDVILVQRESMMSASILFGVKVGSAMENESIAGISHLIEHTVFRGTEKRNSVQIKNPIEEVGGELNAFTSKNFTVYFSKIPTTKVSEAIDILSGLVFEPKFRSEDIEREKSIILEEIASYEDDPGSIVIENLYQHIFDEDFASTFNLKPGEVPLLIKFFLCFSPPEISTTSQDSEGCKSQSVVFKS
jgi:predicted Zn-dependent peptidase